MKKLTPRQALFVQEYLADKSLNAKEAVVRAGYAPGVAKQMGSKLLHHPLVAAAIQAEMDKRARRIGINADDVLAGINKIAVEGEKDADRLRAYELLGKHLKLFTEKHEHAGADGGPLVVEIVKFTEG